METVTLNQLVVFGILAVAAYYAACVIAALAFFTAVEIHDWVVEWFDDRRLQAAIAQQRLEAQQEDAERQRLRDAENARYLTPLSDPPAWASSPDRLR